MLFFICGSVTNFIDFLTTPLISLGLPLAIYLMLRLKNQQSGFFANCVRIVTVSFCWGLGYALTWVSKWVIGSVVLQKNVLAEAMLSAAERTNGQADATFTHGEVILKNIRLFTQFKVPEILLAATTLILGLWLLYVCFKKRTISPLWQHAPFAGLALYPYLWYFVLANHSYHHAFFTFRTQIILPFAVCGCMWVAAADYYREFRPFTAIWQALTCKLFAKKAAVMEKSKSTVTTSNK
ncbi:MAG: hypothetical protein PHG02_05830 [Oscillospiraceae bacterium]|nr:hypothetical protein [Oscillospiraceae bacterium]